MLTCSGAKDCMWRLQFAICFVYIVTRFCFWRDWHCWRVHVCFVSDPRLVHLSEVRNRSFVAFGDSQRSLCMLVLFILLDSYLGLCLNVKVRKCGVSCSGIIVSMNRGKGKIVRLV